MYIVYRSICLFRYLFMQYSFINKGLQPVVPPSSPTHGWGSIGTVYTKHVPFRLYHKTHNTEKVHTYRIILFTQAESHQLPQAWLKILHFLFAIPSNIRPSLVDSLRGAPKATARTCEYCKPTIE